MKTHSRAHSRTHHKSSIKDDEDTHIGIAELSAAAKDIANSQDEEFEFTDDNHIKVKINEDGDKKEGNKKQSIAQADPPAELGGKAGKKPEEKKEEKKDEKNKTAPAVAEPVNQFANWWDDDFVKKKNVKPKDDTPFEIKSHPEYKKLAGRFLGGLFKDKNLETHRKGTAHDTINDDEIDDSKEREGMYPNELDEEMKGYTYGDKLYPAWWGYGYPFNNANNTNYANNYYSNPWLHTANGYSDYWNNQNTFAPPYDPDSHFKSPYYHYHEGYNYYGGYYNNANYGYWRALGYDAYNKRTALLAQANSTEGAAPLNQTAMVQMPPSLPTPDEF
jgi:hypothetical protein